MAGGGSTGSPGARVGEARGAERPVLRELLPRLVLFFALSAPLAWAWMQWGQQLYEQLLNEILTPLYRTLGFRHAQRGPVPPRLVSLVPFLVLMLVTPGMSWRRRLWGAGLGIALLVGFHLVLTMIVDAVYQDLGRTRRSLSKILPLLLINDGLPFLVWLVCARDYLRRVVPGLGEPSSSS